MRGGKEKASRKGDRGEEERPANGDCDSNTEKGERGRGGTGEEREGPVHCPKKVEGACTPRDVRTRGARRSEERGGRKAGGQVESGRVIRTSCGYELARQDETEGTRGRGEAMCCIL